MLRKKGSSLIHQPSTPYPCTSPQSLHEMNLGLVNERELALGGLGPPVTARDRILRCYPRLLERREPGLDSIHKDEGEEVTNSHLIWGGKRIDISM